MAKRLDLTDVNIYYGSFHAVADVSLAILPRSVTAFIGPSGCGKTTVLRTLNRMHEVIPGARVEGAVLLDDQDIYAPGIDPVGVRRAIGMVFQRPNPFPAMSIRNNVVAGLKLQGVRNRKVLDDTAESSLRGANLWDEVRIDWINPAADCLGAAAAVVHRTGNRRATRRVADGRALLLAGPNLHHGHRRPDQRAQAAVHHRHRHP